MEYKAGYKKLNVWVKANELVLLVYKLTKRLPKDEIFGLISQMRRCAISVPANLVEGYGRNTTKDKLRFFYIARGSLNELEYYIDLCFQLGYFTENEYKSLVGLRNDVGRLLNGFSLSLQKH